MFRSPVAEDRGGVEEDFENYVNLLARLRKRLNSSGRKYGLNLILVCSLSSNISAIPLTLSL
jgi:chitinase